MKLVRWTWRPLHRLVPVCLLGLALAGCAGGSDQPPDTAQTWDAVDDADASGSDTGPAELVAPDSSDELLRPDADASRLAAGDIGRDAAADSVDAGPSWPESADPPSPPALPDPQWILLDGDPAAAQRTLAAAAAYGATTVQLSHGLIMAPEDVLDDPVRLANLNEVAEAATDLGLEVLLWSHELEGDVAHLVCFDPAEPLWDVRRQAYRDLLDAVPEADGIVLMFGSAKVEPWHALCTCAWCADHPDAPDPYDPFNSPPSPQRVQQVVRLVADVVVGERGKKLLFRSFVHQPWELVAYGEGVDLLDGVSFQPMSKDVPQDWQPHYPTNPLFGRWPARRHVMEFDAAGEYLGQSVVPFAGVDYVHRRMMDVLRRQAAGFAVRVERGSRSALGTPNELNVYALHGLLADPSQTPQALAASWVAERYGLSVASPENAALVAILRRTEAIGSRTFYNLGFWALRKGSDPPSSCRNPELLTNRSVAKWDDDADWAALEEALQHPDPTVLVNLAQEKHEAAVLAQRNLDELAVLAPALAPEDAADLQQRLALQQATVDAWTAVTAVVWSYQLWLETGDELHAAWTEAALRRLEELAGSLAETFEGDLLPVSPGNLAACAADVRQVFAAEVEPVTLVHPALEPLELEDCDGALCVTLRASEPLELGLSYGFARPWPEREAAGPADPATEHTFRIDDLPSGHWAALRPHATTTDGVLVGAETWVWR